MKRCPSCKFIYLDTDEVCDFDGVKLILIDEKELENSVAPATHAQSSARSKSRTIALAAIVGLGLGVVMFLVYFSAVRRSQSVAQSVQPPVQVSTPAQPTPIPSLMPSPSPSPSPSLSPSPSIVPSPAESERRTDSPASAPSRVNVSKTPVSTSNRSGSQVGSIIRLSSGARIEADEVWRTKEGVWYRRNGLVTLLKASQVRSIEKSSRNQ